AVYVGRGHPLGNPYRIGSDGTREEVVEKYRGWLDVGVRRGDRNILAALRTLRENSDLVCSCAPKPCHAEVIAEVWARERERLTERPAVFVFGANLAGHHGAGAARYAQAVFDARPGVGAGTTGDAYAIPTKDERLKTLPVERIIPEVRRFLRYASEHPDADFLVTPIGTGLAGYPVDWIAPLFAAPPKNVWFTDPEFDRVVPRPTETRRVIVAGSRSGIDQDTVFRALDALAKKWGGGRFEVIYGEASGVDTHGKRWAEARGCPARSFPAPWGDTGIPGAVIRKRHDGTQYNARAGYARNAWMAAYGTHLAAFWDGVSPGTRSMIEIAQACGLPVWQPPVGEPVVDNRARGGIIDALP
ncbi:MAG TPA: DUF4326 domain-containing protein, partial [Chromatiales bacterium]|nr:DUF4326 domain-containing protein [Chromatiales bacterium]